MATYTQTYTFSNGATADGGQVNTEIAALGSSVNSIVNAQVASNAAIAVSKTALGTFTDWTSWTPTVGGFTTGNGSINGIYSQVGKLMTINIRVLFGSTSSTASAFTISNLPANANNTNFSGSVFALDSSTSNRYYAVTFFNSVSEIQIANHGLSASWGNTVPFTWASADYWFFSLTYAVA